MTKVERRRGAGTIAITIVLTLLAANALVQAAAALVDWNSDPAQLTAFQFASGSSALAAAIGTWRRARWAVYLALGYGVITGIMIASLGSILELEEEARTGLRLSAAIVFLIGVALAWGIRRTQLERPQG